MWLRVGWWGELVLVFALAVATFGLLLAFEFSAFFDADVNAFIEAPFVSIVDVLFISIADTPFVCLLDALSVSALDSPFDLFSLFAFFSRRSIAVPFS